MSIESRYQNSIDTQTVNAYHKSTHTQTVNAYRKSTHTHKLSIPTVSQHIHTQSANAYRKSTHAHKLSMPTVSQHTQANFQCVSSQCEHNESCTLGPITLNDNQIRTKHIKIKQTNTKAKSAFLFVFSECFQ